MKIELTDFVRNEHIQTGDFDRIWAELGRNVKFMLRTYDPNITWLNIYLSHDGKPGFTRTIVRTQEQ